MDRPSGTARRAPLSRERVLRAAVAYADGAGIDALSMRGLAQELGVVPMALYKHVANKDELLDGLVDAVLAEIAPPVVDGTWKAAVRERILSARQVLLRHPWAARVITSRAAPTPGALAYLDSVIGTLRGGGLSVDLAHHAMHALGSRVLGFTQELVPTGVGTTPGAETGAGAGAGTTADSGGEVGGDGGGGDPAAAGMRELAARYPHIAAVVADRTHDGASVVGAGCDDQFEFEFALDLLLEGIERLHRQGWTSATAGRA
ncbi:TetR/AcrR family transcriptional regulator C-terminal domain-containing protein [Streptomyces sp. NPDC093225]|uniref:TetR/AcrR family transcriptional regulator C-terminal domain-containing protein n=1 Tax=Streptomyces sp. NPDC093225 TaxID=3366034 RepID=UPI0037FA5AEF